MLSRWMPQYAEPKAGPLSRVVLVVLAAGVLWYLLRHPLGFLVGGTLVGLVWLVSIGLDRRLARRARERAGEDLCTFARAFDRRSPHFDPWIVRAVWDALAPWTCTREGGRFPLRPTDMIAEFGCVGEDLDDVFVEAATRAGRQITSTSGNPFYGRVLTVGDLVACITHQLRVAAA